MAYNKFVEITYDNGERTVNTTFAALGISGITYVDLQGRLYLKNVGKVTGEERKKILSGIRPNPEGQRPGILYDSEENLYRLSSVPNEDSETESITYRMNRDLIERTVNELRTHIQEKEGIEDRLGKSSESQ